MLEQSKYSLNIKKAVVFFLSFVMLYMLVFGGIDLRKLNFGSEKVKHIAVIEKGEDYTIYRNNDGSNTLEMIVDAVKEGSFVSIEDSIYDYKSIDDESNIYINPDFNVNEPSIKISKADMKIELVPITSSVSSLSEVEGYNKEDETYSKAYSKDAFGEGIDIEYTSIEGGLKENIILNSPVSTSEFNYILNTDGLKAELVANNILLLDKNSEHQYTISAPVMTDNNSSECYLIEVKLEEITHNSQYKITIIPDKEWLNDIEREYPVVIDPSILSRGASLINDSYVSNDTGRSNMNYDTATMLEVGLEYTDNIYRSYIDFNMPSTIPDHIIVTDAEITIGRSNTQVAYCYTALYEPNSTWNSSTITWNNQPGNGRRYSDVVLVTRDRDYIYDATSYAMDIFPNGEYIGDAANKGVVLRATNESTHTGYLQKRMDSSETAGGTLEFEITYNVPINMPAPTTTVYGNGANSHDGYVELSWDAVVGANGYYVGIFNGDEYQMVDVNNVTSWSTQNQNIWPTQSQTTVGEYELRVDANGDPKGDGDELYIFPNMAYRNAPDGTVDYDNDTNYYFIVIPQNTSGYMAVPGTCDKAVLKLPDVIEPNTPSSLTVDPPSWTNSTNHTLEWTDITDYNGTNFAATNIGSIEYVIETGAVTAVSGGATWIDTSETDGDGSYTIDTSSLADGIYTVFQRTVDNAAPSNTSDESYVNMYIDRTNPVIGAGGFTSDAENWINTDTVTFTYDTISDATSGIDYAQIYEGLSYIGDVDTGLSTYTLDTSAETYDESIYTLHIADNAGNEITADAYVRIDKLAPQVEITSPIDLSSVNNIIEIWGTCTDGQYESMDSYVLEVIRYDNLGTYIETVTIENGSNSYYSGELINILDTSSFNDGDILEIHMSATDKVGNTTEDTVTVTVDRSVVTLDETLTITTPSNGGIAGTDIEQIVYTRDSSATGTLDFINFFVDGSLFIRQAAGDVFFETLRYLEGSQHSIALVGENSNGDFEYCQNISERIALSSVMSSGDISSSNNITFSTGGIELTNPALTGNVVFNPINLSSNDLTYLVNASSLTPTGTSVDVEVSFDGGTTWTSITNNTEYILENESLSTIVRLTLTGDGVNSPTVMSTQVKCASIQNPYNITVQTVTPVEGLQVVSNTKGRITIQWNGSFDPDVKYDVYRGITSSFAPSTSNRVFTQSNSTVYADTSVSQGVTYYYKVIATKTYSVAAPYIAFRESAAKTISVTAYKTPVYTYDDNGEDDDDTAWGNEEEIEDAGNANDLYGGNWTVNNELPPPEGANEMNQSMLGARTFCAAGFEPINFVSGNFFMKQLDDTYSVLPDVNSSILRTYNTQSDEDNGPIGNGWSWYYGMHLKLYSTGDIGMIKQDGHLAMFRIQQDGTYLNDEDELISLSKTVDEYIVTYQNKDKIVFDSGGQLKSIISKNGNTTKIEYDNNGIIDKVVYSTGETLDITTDINGHITLIVLPNDEKLYYEYSGNNLVKYYDAAGKLTIYEYDQNGRMTAWYDKEGARQVYNVYDDEDRVVEQWDANGYYYKLEYGNNYVSTTNAEGDINEYYFDDMGRTTKIVDSEGYSQEYEYNVNSQVVQYTDKLGKVTKYEYDSNNNLIKEITNDNRMRQYTYDANNNLTGETDYLGNWTKYEYDSNNNLIKRTYPDSSAYTYEYNEDNQLIKLTNPAGYSELYEYDGENMVRHTDANGNITKYEYNSKDELIKITDAKGNVTKMEYNAAGNITKTILPDNTSMSYIYDAMDNMTVFEDAKGQATKFEYDALGHMTKTINADGSEILYEYDGNGNMVKTIYPDGTYIVNTYDSSNNLISTVDQDGKTYKMTYNPAGDIWSIAEPNGTVSRLSYDKESGWLKKTYDGNYNTTEYEYDANGNVTKIIYTDGTTTEYTYDAMGRVKTQVLNNGAKTTYNYDKLGQLESIVDPEGNATWYVYDKLGQLMQIVDSLGNRTTFEYDAVGNMTSMTDASGEKIEYSYDAVSQLEKIIAPLGGSVEYNYDPNGQLQKLVNALGADANNEYDEMGRVVKSTNLLGAETLYEYDIVGNMVRETNALGNSFNYEYDSNGNIIKITDALGNEAKFAYDVMSNITKIEGEEGYAEEYEYDKLNRVVKTKDSEGYEKQYEYDDMGRLTKESDNTGKSVSYTYTTVGQVKKITNAEGETTELFYDLNGNTTKVLYADSTAETYHYNELNQLIRQYDRVGLETTYKYDSVGNVVEVKQPSSKVYKYEYDANGNLVKETNPEGGETKYTYDDAGNVLSVTDPMGNTTKIEYNNASMIEKVIDAAGTTTLKIDYSILGEVITETDALGNATNYRYDELSRLIAVVDPLNRETKYKYDGADNITSVIDANSNIVNYEYNTKGMLTKETDPLGNVESYSYYVDGLLESITKADGTSSKYSYDLAGRMTDVSYSDGTAIDYGYNEIGSVTTMTDKTGTTTYQYDDMQRLVSTTDSLGKTVEYAYDILGRKTSITTPDNIITNYTYDNMDRLVEVIQNDEVIAEYSYNANSQLINNVRNEITTTYDYNELGQLTQLTTSDISKQIQQFTYQYDAIGNIIEEVRVEQDTTNTRTYDYDNANQLVEFKDNDYIEKYTYDSVGNMSTKSINDLETSYDYNAGNQLISELTNEEQISYNYNSNGDLISKSTGENYTYDIQGNLTSITGNGIDKEYSYSGTGKRISETTDDETIYYVNDINRSYEQVLQIYNDEGIIDTYTYGLQRIDSKGETNETYLYDGRGSVAGTIGTDNILVSYSYTAYGELIPDSPTPKLFGFNSEQTDYTTGLQYLRARYYDTAVQRFVQEDDYRGEFTNPASMNRHIYTEGNPVMGIDPSGYGVIDDYKYQMEQKSRQASSSNFYVDYYTNKAKQAEPEVQIVHNTAEYYQYMYGKDTPKVQYNDNGEVLVKNPFAAGPDYVTIEEYNCLRDGKDKEALQYTEEYDKSVLYPDNDKFKYDEGEKIEYPYDWSENSLFLDGSPYPTWTNLNEVGKINFMEYDDGYVLTFANTRYLNPWIPLEGWKEREEYIDIWYTVDEEETATINNVAINVVRQSMMAEWENSYIQHMTVNDELHWCLIGGSGTVYHEESYVLPREYIYMDMPGNEESTVVTTFSQEIQDVQLEPGDILTVIFQITSEGSYEMPSLTKGSESVDTWGYARREYEFIYNPESPER